MEANIEKIANDIISRLEEAWNSADGKAFGTPFTTDADFIDLRGDIHHSHKVIEAGHQAIFDSIYKGSRMKYTLLQARNLSDNVLLVHFWGELNAPSGPLAGEHKSIQSIILVQQDDDWKIASFHNTLVAQQR